MSTTLAETAEWLDGPSIYAWVMDNAGIECVSYLPENLDRAMRRWKEGGRASIWSVDELLTYVDGPAQLWQIPEDVYRDSKRAARNKLTAEQKAEIAERVARGEKVKALAREFDVAPDTIRYNSRAKYREERLRRQETIRLRRRSSASLGPGASPPA